MAVVALTACGGAPEVGETPTAAAAVAPPVVASGAAVVEVAAPRETAQLLAPAAYDIRLVDQSGWHREVFVLVPVRGAGYQTLHALVVLRGPSALSPVAGVEPYCPTALRCEYVPPRKGDYAERYTVSLSDDSVAQLSTTNGLIAISARQLEVDQPSIVSVTLTVDGQLPVTKRITYAKLPG
jgi:hypothetical protein